jgi:hypothetical protein
MTRYIVHLYREMRLTYTAIEAETPEAAAAIAGGKATDDADNIEDCEGENLSVLVDVAGDDEYEHSRSIDFETERQRKAAPKLLAALKAVLPYAQSEHASLFECCRRDRESAAEQEAERCAVAIDQAVAAIADAQAVGIITAATHVDIHAGLAKRREIAAIPGLYDFER